MAAQTFLILLILNLFHTSQILLPINDENFFAKLSNVSCASDVHHWRLASQPGMPVVSELQNATLACSGNLDFFSYSGSIHFRADVWNSSTVLIDHENWIPPPQPKRHVLATVEEDTTIDEESDEDEGEDSSSGGSKVKTTELTTCDINVSLSDFSVYPAEPLLDLLLVEVQKALNNYFPTIFCKFLMPYYESLLFNADVLIPETPPEDATELNAAYGVSELAHSELFSSFVHLIHALPPPVKGAKVSASFLGTTALRLSCHFEEGASIQYVSGDEKNWKFLTILLTAVFKRIPLDFLFASETFRDLMLGSEEDILFPLQSIFPGGLKLPWSEDTTAQLSLFTSLPPNTTVFFDVNFRGFQWASETRTFHVLQNQGIFITNLRVEKAGKIGAMLTNYVLPSAMRRLNFIINASLQLFPTESVNSGMVSFTLPQPDTRQIPVPSILVGFGLSSLLLCTAVVIRGLHFHHKSPILSSIHFESVSFRRLIVEDLILSIGVCVCFGCFVWSNSTIAATVVLGDNLSVYSFSLRSTVIDLWNAGLSPLAFAVAFFSGVYPYVKLAGVLYYTAWKHKPDSSVLHAMDCIGKLSLLDTFVMLMMVAGLTIPGVADVQIFPPFYIFLVGTLGSIAMGNYATHVWRRNTTLRSEPERVVVNLDSSGSDFSNEDSSRRLFDSISMFDVTSIIRSRNMDQDESPNRGMCPLFLQKFFQIVLCTGCNSKSQIQGLRRGLFIMVASAPAWFFPLVSYRVGGIGPLLTTSYKSFNLTQLCLAVDPICVVVAAVTVFFAPLIFVMSPHKLCWVASWCAADALAVACLAGLLQLDQFVEFILGDDLVGLYSAQAVLHLALLPLLMASLYVWWLVVADLLHWDGFVDAWRHIKLACKAFMENEEDLRPLLSSDSDTHQCQDENHF